jgi:YidC/Oxa1 family membrane protein insertase
MEPADQRNILLALVLCFGLFALYNIFVLEPQQRQRQQEIARSKEQVVTTTPSPTQLLRPREDIIREELAAGTRVPLDAPAISGSVSLKGGRIDDVSLKGFYETIQDKLANREAGQVHLFSPNGTERAFYGVTIWKSPSGTSTEDVAWSQTSTGPLTPTNPLTLSLALTGARIDRTITVDDNYMFSVSDTFTNTSAAAITVTPETYVRQRLLNEHLKPAQGAHAGSIGAFGDKRNQMTSYNDLNKGKGVVTDVNAGWIGLTTKYWMGAAIPQQGETVQFRANVDKANGETIFNAGYAAAGAYTIQPTESVTKTSRIFAGAKRVSVLDRYENEAGIPSFTDAVDWSWLFFITKPFFWMLQTFQGWFGAFGWAILALTIVVKTVFFPLQFNMYKSMSKMRKLQPQMQEIQTRFAADPQRMRLEQANLWKREKVNPVAGCLPMIPQIFVFYALYHTLMVTLEMRHTPFLGTWIQDMSAPDPISIFNLFGLIPWNPGAVPLIGAFLMIGPWALLYGLTMVLLQGMSAPPTDPMQRAIMRWIPLVFTILFAGFAAGLVIYWVWSNLITLVQQYIIMRRTGVETEFDKFFKKYLGKKPPTDGGDKSARAPAE